MIQQVKKQIEHQLCSLIPNAFWNMKQHIIYLPYEKDFTEKQIPTKVRPIQWSCVAFYVPKMLEYCKIEIQVLLDKKLIRPSHSPWSCATFYVQKNFN